MPPRIAVDAMGGDNAPGEIVAGAAQAATEDGAHLLLVGRQDEISKALADAGASTSDTIEIVDAADVIDMDDSDPARAVRSRRDSSISVASRLVKEGRADAVFSAGATGAALAGAVLETGRIRGVARPAIAVVLPFRGAETVLLDAGANADVRPEHLVGFGVLGDVFARIRLGLDSPRVGLLSVGEEPGKGNDLAKASYALLAASDLNFIGNVEGRDITSDRVDVVVTDGFTGNVVLKLLEGFGKFLMGELFGVFSATDEAKEAAKVVMPGLLELAATLSPETHGGAHLLGVKGVCIIGHGSSSAAAVRSALRIASETVQAGLVGEVVRRLGSRKEA
ncbi:MAG: phosphate acyltransferase PlsX [Actinomycetota bacterium]